jgi:hypothetical protein
MRLVGMISTAVLSLTLGSVVPVYAQQEQREQKEEPQAKPEEQKARPAQTPKTEEKKAQPARPADKPSAQRKSNAKPQPKSAKPAAKDARQQEPQHAKPVQEAKRGGGGRIPDDRFKANFGQEHRFRVNQADYRNHRFQYGGYSFGFVDPWPSNWLYTQDVYVVEIDGVYYLCNPMYPGVNLALSFTL